MSIFSRKTYLIRALTSLALAVWQIYLGISNNEQAYVFSAGLFLILTILWIYRFINFEKWFKKQKEKLLKEDDKKS